MKTDTIVIIAAAGLGLYLVSRMTGNAIAARSTAQSLNNGGTVDMGVAREIFNTALPGQPGWGWKYYTDGTAIGPDGTYYKAGEKVWSPT